MKQLINIIFVYAVLNFTIHAELTKEVYSISSKNAKLALKIESSCKIIGAGKASPLVLRYYFEYADGGSRYTEKGSFSKGNIDQLSKYDFKKPILIKGYGIKSLRDGQNWKLIYELDGNENNDKVKYEIDLTDVEYKELIKKIVSTYIKMGKVQDQWSNVAKSIQ